MRNLAWSADELDLQPRPDNFASTEQHLAWMNADLIFAAFGFNESLLERPGFRNSALNSPSISISYVLRLLTEKALRVLSSSLQFPTKMLRVLTPLISTTAT